ncbi:bZIP transcription factor [Ceratocystis lukuohia]|uniref:Putative transcription factor kapC n=1 Tax=Ceratocystis lukuohia TaxID=2019550 RepID=A0ABR4MUA8_9PEZI
MPQTYPPHQSPPSPSPSTFDVALPGMDLLAVSYPNPAVGTIFNTFDYANVYPQNAAAPGLQSPRPQNFAPVASLAAPEVDSRAGAQAQDILSQLDFSVFNARPADSSSLQVHGSPSPDSVSHTPSPALTFIEDQSDPDQSGSPETIVCGNSDASRSKKQRGSRYKNASPAVLGRRRAQNRASQRAYRQRKEQRIQDLEKELDEQKLNYANLQAVYMDLQRKYAEISGCSPPNTLFFPSLAVAANAPTGSRLSPSYGLPVAHRRDLSMSSLASLSPSLEVPLSTPPLASTSLPVSHQQQQQVGLESSQPVTPALIPGNSLISSPGLSLGDGWPLYQTNMSYLAV